MKQIIVTSFDHHFYQSGLSLIASIHRHSWDCVAEIIIYDLGLTVAEATEISHYQKVTLLKYPPMVAPFYDGYLIPQQHAYKLFVVKAAGDYGDLICWLDAGVIVLRDLEPIYNQLQQNDIFLVQDYHRNLDWTHQRALELMQANEIEKNAGQLCSGIIGYKKNGKFQQLIDKAYEYSLNPEIVLGDHQNHRHDQSIYSILAARYQCPTNPIERYGEWRGIIHSDQVIYVHRNTYVNLAGLKIY